MVPGIFSNFPKNRELGQDYSQQYLTQYWITSTQSQSFYLHRQIGKCKCMKSLLRDSKNMNDQNIQNKIYILNTQTKLLGFLGYIYKFW